MKNSNQWMAISGLLGLAFFIIANLTRIFEGLNQVAAVLQLLFNAFVFITWGSAFLHSTGLRKFITFFGTIIPLIMASITVYRVLWPW